LVFTGHEFGEGGEFIAKTLEEQKIKASFFFTGSFYANPAFKKTIEKLKSKGNYLGPHSNEHLLYCDWNKRDSLLVSKKQFTEDLLANYKRLADHGIQKQKASFFLPPYEWYNDSISQWTKELGLQLINFTPGTLSHADYTTTSDNNYRSSEMIYNSIINYEQTKSSGLNGFKLLMHIGVGPGRTDKFYKLLPGLIKYLKAEGYQFQTIEEILKTD
jgi:peptidoglycan/xylan/chitin deacetylase (PgdA/CDA1 family)